MIFGPPPAFEHLSDQATRASLISLRQAVAPILANNLLPHFTDHSVAHSDNLVGLVDQLIRPLQQRDERLVSQELVALYSASYLHDIGMQYEDAGNTRTIRDLNLSQVWDKLPEATRRDLLRQHHASISAEMVQASIRSPIPPVGIQMTPEYEPSSVAALCEAHVLDVASPLYKQLTEPEPRIRMGLVSGLLRIADILDESRRRATREKARTLLLDLTAQAHWWRHYYTEDVTINQTERVVEVWFDFPEAAYEEYSQIVPRLQMPWIEAELLRHHRHFIRAGFGWAVTALLRAKRYGDTETMPSQVQAAMLEMVNPSLPKKLAVDGASFARDDAVQHFVEARPYLHRRVDELREMKNSVPPEDYLRQVMTLAEEMWGLGARRSAWRLVYGEFDRDAKSLAAEDRLDMGLRLSAWMQEDDSSGDALRILERLREEVGNLPEQDARRLRFWTVRAHCANDECIYDTAIESFEHAISFAEDHAVKELLRAELAEMHLIQGEFDRANRTLSS